MVYAVQTTSPTGAKIDAGFLALENPAGPTGPDASAAAITIHEVSGPSAPPGATNGDLVVNKVLGDIQQVTGGTLTDSPRVPTGPLGTRFPLIGGRGYLVGMTGDTGPAGGVATHDHGGTLDITYRPTTYQEMWQESYVPVLPPAPTLVGPITLVGGRGNDVQVQIPPVSTAGAPHPFPGWQLPGVDLPSIDFSRLRVAVIRGPGGGVAPTNPSPWLGMSGIVDYTDVVGSDVTPGQTIVVSLQTAWPMAANDELWVYAYLWDRYGNGPVASAVPVKAAVTYTPPALVDMTPPGSPTVSVVWNDTTGQYTVTITAPTDPDIKELHLWQQPDSTTPNVTGAPTVIPTTPGQVHTLTFTPKLDDFPSLPYPPPGWMWADPTHTHGIIRAAWYVLAYDKNNNGSSPGTASDYQPASSVRSAPATYVPPSTITLPGNTGGPGGPGGGAIPGVQQVYPPIQPKPPGAAVQHRQEDSHMQRAKSRAYDRGGSRADSQWGTGVMHTGRYGSVHGVQWGGSYIDLTHLAGWRVTEFVLHFRTEHTYYNDGARISLGWHSFKNGMPSTCLPTRNGAYFRSLGDVHVPKSGPVSVRLSNTIGQKFVDGQAFGFLFGGPADTGQRSYAAIDINSVWVHIEVER